LTKVLKDNPDYLEGYNLMARAYTMKGDQASAARYQAIYNQNKK
jgi:predicted Zn-dependent protease